MTKYKINDKIYEPIVFGMEMRYLKQLEGEVLRGYVRSLIEGRPCHACGVKPLEQHKDGCDWEECPDCGQQMISCGDKAVEF